MLQANIHTHKDFSLQKPLINDTRWATRQTAS